MLEAFRDLKAIFELRLVAKISKLHLIDKSENLALPLSYSLKSFPSWKIDKIVLLGIDCTGYWIISNDE